MLININVYVEVNPPSNQSYKFLLNGQEVEHKIINDFADDTGHIYESLLTVDVKDISKNTKLILKVDDLTPGHFVQIRELFLDDIKMDHVLLLVSKVYFDDTVLDGTRLQDRPGQLEVTFDNPVWSWWCHNLRSIEVIENQGWRIKQL